jgi:hypothetical protein
MTKGAIVFTQVVDYTDEGIPLVYCYLILGPTVSVRTLLFHAHLTRFFF